MIGELTDTRTEIPNSLRLSQLVVALRTLWALRSEATRCEELYGVLAVQLRAMLLDARRDSPKLLFSVFESYGEECCVFVSRGSLTRSPQQDFPQAVFEFVNPFVSRHKSDISTKKVKLQEALDIKCLAFSGSGLTLGEAIKRRAEVLGGAHYARLWRAEDLRMRQTALGVLHKCILAVCDAVLEAGYEFVRKHTELSGLLSIKLSSIPNVPHWQFVLPGIFSANGLHAGTFLNAFHPVMPFSACVFFCPLMGLSLEIKGAHGNSLKVVTGYCPLPGCHQVIFFRTWLDREFCYNASLEVSGLVAASEKASSFIEFVYHPVEFLTSVAAAERQTKASSIEFSFDIIRLYGVANDAQLNDIRSECARLIESGMSSDKRDVGGTCFFLNGSYFCNPEDGSRET